MTIPTNVSVAQLPEGESTKTKSSALSHAGRALNALRIQARQMRSTGRKFTGRVFKQRARIGWAVILPDGAPGWIKMVQKGHACIRTAEVFEDTFLHVYLPVALLRPYRSPEAAVLGRAKKGVIEHKSVTKAESCRRNGAMPVKPGSRPRGRPFAGKGRFPARG
jgi:hypothetical protein